jgi:hypothetical protein
MSIGRVKYEKNEGEKWKEEEEEEGKEGEEVTVC